MIVKMRMIMIAKLIKVVFMIIRIRLNNAGDNGDDDDVDNSEKDITNDNYL